MKEEKQERYIIHLHLKSTNEDYYYGSLSAIYDDFDTKSIKVALNTLYNFNLEIGKEYENEVVTIKKGLLKTKKRASNK